MKDLILTVVVVVGFISTTTLLMILMRKISDLHDATNGLLKMNQALAREGGAADERLAQMKRDREQATGTVTSPRNGTK